MTISIVTTALPHRKPFLRRLVAQAPWIRAYDWIICGPHARPTEPAGWQKVGELERFAREMGARFIPSSEPMGTCRNLCADAARGEIIVQVDDDDWQHPGRLERQELALHGGSAGRPEVVGSSWLYCLHAKTATASRLSYWDGLFCLPGATLAYWRSAWFRHPFEPVQAEDGPFTSFFGKEGSCVDMHDPKLLVYMRHEEHLPEQRDWWRESRTEGRKISALEQVRRRLENPGQRLAMREAAVSRDVVLAHENEAATVYVRWLMGEPDFRLFCGLRSVELSGEVVDDKAHDFDAPRE